MNDRTELLILKILKYEKATSKSSGMTLKEFPLDDLGVGANTLYKRLKVLEQKGLIQKGYKDSQAFTYFVTTDGLSILEKEKVERNDEN